MSDRFAATRGLGWSGWTAVLLLAVTVAIAARSGVALIGSLFGPSGEDSLADRRGLDPSEDILRNHVAQIDGRTMFFTPDAPPPPPPQVTEREPEAPRPDPAPSRYGGPAIVGMMFDSVWFSNEMRLQVGESGSGVRVISMDAPWSARLEWRDVEFDVPFMERDQVVLDNSAEESGSARQPEGRRASRGDESGGSSDQDPTERNGDRSQ